MNVDELISKLGIGKKETIYLSITPGVGLELIQLDVRNKIVKNYGYKPLYYNESLRELAEFETFKTAVSDLFAEMRLNTRCDVVLNIPMVLIGGRELPVILADDAISEALTSEAEQSYIFKRYEPVISWVEATGLNPNANSENRKFYYSAIQKNVLEGIKSALQELGMTLVDIQLSTSSILRALMYSGFLEEQTKDGVSWNLMLVTSNGYSILSMLGKNIVDYYEEPLAIKSFDGEELYGAMNASAQIALMSYPASHLVVVSETDLLSAELLSSRLNFDGQISYYENNDFKKNDLIQVSLEVLEEAAHKISLEAIGNAVSSAVALPIEFNFMGESTNKKADNPDEPIHVVLGSTEFDISQNGARNISIIISTLILIPFIILFISVPMITRSKQAQANEMNSKLEQFKKQVESLQEEQNRYDNFDINDEVKNVVANNRIKLMGYIALGESVPKDLWLTYFLAQGNGKFDIKGKAKSVQDIYSFYSNMKESLINVPLNLQQLEMESQNVDDAVSPISNALSTYKFEITNMSASDFAPKEDKSSNKSEDGQTQKQQNTDNGDDMLNKPLLNMGRDN